MSRPQNRARSAAWRWRGTSRRLPRWMPRWRAPLLRARQYHVPPQKVFWGGYTGVFADPDGHLWEVAHNPAFPLSADGRLALPD